MFAHLQRDEDDDGDADMGAGIGLPAQYVRSSRQQETKRSVVIEDSDSDEEMTRKPTAAVAAASVFYNDPALLAMQAMVAATAARIKPVESKAAAASAKPAKEEAELECELVSTTAKPEDVEPAVLFVCDMSGALESAPRRQTELVGRLIGDQALNALVVNRGKQELHVTEFNSGLVCPKCGPSGASETVTQERNGVGGSGVHRTRARACKACTTPQNEWVKLRGRDMALDAKSHAAAIHDALKACVLVPSFERRCDADESWKAALGVLQSLSSVVIAEDKSARRVQKVVVLMTQRDSHQELLLTMPMHAKASLELVPVIPVFFHPAAAATAAAEHQSRPWSAAACAVHCSPTADMDGVVAAIRSRIKQAVRERPICVSIQAAAQQARWLTVPPFAPVLLPPWFKAHAYVKDNKSDSLAVHVCEGGGLVDTLRACFEQDPDFNKQEVLLSFNAVERLRLSAAIIAAAAEAAPEEEEEGDKNVSGRSTDVSKEGAVRGAKRRKR